MSAKSQNGISPEIEQAIAYAVGPAFAAAQKQQTVLANHQEVVQAAGNTIALTTAAQTVIAQNLTAKGTGKYRVQLSGFVQNLGTLSTKFATITITQTVNGAGTTTIATLPGVLAPQASNGAAGYSWTVETTAIATIGQTAGFNVNALANDSTNLEIPGGGTELGVQEIF